MDRGRYWPKIGINISHGSYGRKELPIVLMSITDPGRYCIFLPNSQVHLIVIVRIDPSHREDNEFYQSFELMVVCLKNNCVTYSLTDLTAIMIISPFNESMTFCDTGNLPHST